MFVYRFRAYQFRRKLGVLYSEVLFQSEILNSALKQCLHIFINSKLDIGINMTSVQLKKSTPPTAGATSLIQELPEYTAFKSVVVYSAGILILPILAFFVLKIFLFDSILSLNIVSSNVSSAVCAIIVLHITLGMFIYKAYSGTDKVAKQD